MGQNVKANTFEFKTVRNLHHSEKEYFNYLREEGTKNFEVGCKMLTYCDVYASWH